MLLFARQWRSHSPIPQPLRGLPAYGRLRCRSRSGLTVSGDVGHVIVNDGLMTIFFFVVGLEVKRELVHGALRGRAKALLAVFAALYCDDTPFKRNGVKVGRCGHPTSARLDIWGAFYGMSSRRAVEAAMAGCPERSHGPLSSASLESRQNQDSRMRIVPVGERLAAVLEMLRTDPAGNDLPAEGFVFGDETGGNISSVKTAWRSACVSADTEDLHFHDLRREVACRLLETRAELHDVAISWDTPTLRRPRGTCARRRCV